MFVDSQILLSLYGLKESGISLPPWAAMSKPTLQLHVHSKCNPFAVNTYMNETWILRKFLL